MLSIQKEIDKLVATLGATHPDVIEAKSMFEKLSQDEMTKTTSTTSHHIDLTPIKIDTTIIREQLEIREGNSVDFSFIADRTEELKRVKVQLIKDNLRMENARLDLILKSELDRFYTFCVNAFYQIEELINFYFTEKHPAFKDFIAVMQAKNPSTNYGDKTVISQIEVAQKMYVFEKLFYPAKYDDRGNFIFSYSTLNLIRDVRNEESHRCSIIEKNEANILADNKALIEKVKQHNFTRADKSVKYIKSPDEKNIEKQARLIPFIKEKNYNKVRDAVRELSNKIKDDLSL
ncbi:MAG: hypothetical protein WKF85_15480 [Chitinophagaceae bacterium]